MYKTRSLPLILAMLLMALALTACGKDKQPANAPPATAAPALAQATAASEAPAQEAPAASTATESPLLAAGASPLASPVADSPIPTPTPELSGATGETTAETGAVTGKILVRKDGEEIAVANMIIGLADVIRDESGAPKASGYAPGTAKKGVTGDDGSFAVNDVPPGTYSLILDAAVSSYQLENPLTHETVLVDVESGKVFDIGVLHYDSLPLPGFAN